MFILAAPTGGEDAVSKPVMTDDSSAQADELLYSSEFLSFPVAPIYAYKYLSYKTLKMNKASMDSFASVVKI